MDGWERVVGLGKGGAEVGDTDTFAWGLAHSHSLTNILVVGFRLVVGSRDLESNFDVFAPACQPKPPACPHHRVLAIVLFPPCTMLAVLPGNAALTTSSRRDPWAAATREHGLEPDSFALPLGAVTDRFAGMGPGGASNMHHTSRRQEGGRTFTSVRVRPYFL